MLQFTNGNGEMINVEPDTVEAVVPGGKGESVLRIGTVGVVVKGAPKDTAGKISKARGWKCPVEKLPKGPDDHGGQGGDDDGDLGGEGEGEEGRAGGEGPGEWRRIFAVKCMGPGEIPGVFSFPGGGVLPEDWGNRGLKQPN